MNPVEIEEAISNLAESTFDPAEFPYSFLAAFGNRETTIKRLRSGESNKSDLGGVLQTNNIHIAIAAAGEVTKTLAALKASPATTRAKAKFVLATDGDTFEAEDLVSGETVACVYAFLLMALCSVAGPSLAHPAKAGIVGLAFIEQTHTTHYRLGHPAPNSTTADGSYFLATPGVPELVAQYGIVNDGTCADAGPPLGSANVAPSHGSISFQVAPNIIGPGQPCAGTTIQFLQVFYTWTDTTSGATQDNFSINYSYPDGELYTTIPYTASIEAFTPDKQIGDSNTPGTCQCGDPASGITRFTYDAHDRILSARSAIGALTTYTYDGFGRLVKRISPDTGTTQFGYDAADNLLASMDGAGVGTNHTYDALNRVTSTTYPADAGENVSYTYDQPGHGFSIGHLTSLIDAAGSEAFAYDERGNELTDARGSGSVALTTQYSYDAASRLAGIGYSS